MNPHLLSGGRAALQLPGRQQQQRRVRERALHQRARAVRVHHERSSRSLRRHCRFAGSSTCCAVTTSCLLLPARAAWQGCGAPAPAPAAPGCGAALLAASRSWARGCFPIVSAPVDAPLAARTSPEGLHVVGSPDAVDSKGPSRLPARSSSAHSSGVPLLVRSCSSLRRAPPPCRSAGSLPGSTAAAASGRFGLANSCVPASASSRSCSSTTAARAARRKWAPPRRPEPVMPPGDRCSQA
jgi:hypothetical protein